MIEVNLYSVSSGDFKPTVGKLVARSRFDKDAMGIGVMKFVKGFLKDNADNFQSAIHSPEIMNMINDDTPMTTRDFSCINYYLVKAGFYVQIQNVADNEENANDIPLGVVEWNVLDHNFIQNDYPTAVKIIPSEGQDIVEILKNIVGHSGLFDVNKFSGVKNPFTSLLANLESIKKTNGSINSAITTKIYELLDEMGINVFCSTSAA